MGGQGSGRHPTYLMPKDPEKALELAEGIVLKFLGEKNHGITRDRAKYAFMLYLRRIPSMTEEVGNTAKTIINNIINNAKQQRADDNSRLVLEREADSSQANT